MEAIGFNCNSSLQQKPYKSLSHEIKHRIPISNVYLRL